MSTPTLFIRRAHREDIDTIYRWRHATAAWLTRTHGTDQWSNPYPRANLERWVDRGETYMVSLSPEGDPVATITSSTEGDPALWTPAELEVPARYVSKVNVVRAHAGRDIGATLFAWARHTAALAGVELVRIDVWSTNEKLKDYYHRRGWQYLRTVPDIVPPSGALFEISAAKILGLPVVEMFEVARAD